MQTPPSLQAGDKIAIIATARKISQQELQPAVEMLRKWGFDPVYGRNLFRENHQFSGTDQERAEDLQWALDDENIKAVLCARGGYGSVRIIDSIDFSKFQLKPKWVIGYSDVCVLHSHIHQVLYIETLHAIMPVNFPKDGTENQSLITFKKALHNENIKYTTTAHPLNRNGNAEGIIVGGNLSILYSLSGTTSDINTDGKILFIEDLDEYLYHIDRMMMNLKRNGKLAKLAALIVGGMTDMNDNTVPYGKTAEEIISDAVAEYSYPVCFQFPAGHQDDNRALILGREIILKIGENVELEFVDPKKKKKDIFSTLKKSYGFILIITALFVFIYTVIKFINYLLG
ncbi:MAG: S66 peptidase family protein [Bacteroidales bacterium]